MTRQQGLDRSEFSSLRWRKMSNFFCYATGNGFFSRKEQIADVVDSLPLEGSQSNVAPQQGLRHLVVSR